MGLGGAAPISLMDAFGVASRMQAGFARLDGFSGLRSIAAKASSRMNFVPRTAATVVMRGAARPASLMERLQGLDWFQFERLVAVLYEQKGYGVKRLGGA